MMKPNLTSLSIPIPERRVAQKTSFEEVVRKARGVHGNAYSYQSRVKLPVGVSGDFWFIRYTCELHGSIEQRQDGHLRGAGCSACAFEAQAARQSLNFAQFLERVPEANLRKFIYLSLHRATVVSSYCNTEPIVSGICTEGHLFEASAGNHLSKSVGCGVCTHRKGVFKKLLAQAPERVRFSTFES